MNYFATPTSFQLSQVPVMWVCMENGAVNSPGESEVKEVPSIQELLLENQKLKEHIERLSVISASPSENIAVESTRKNGGQWSS